MNKLIIKMIAKCINVKSIAISCVLFSTANAKTFEYDAGAQTSCRLSVAKFTMWTPEDVDKVKGVFVLIPGRNSDGRKMATKAKYQKMATKYNFAIVALFLRSVKGDTNTYQLDGKGHTAKLIDKAIKKLEKESSIEGLGKKPLFLIGNSAGANISVKYAGHNSKRTIGVVATVPTIGPGGNSGKKGKVPMLVITGAKDKGAFLRQSQAAWKGASKSNLWTKAHHKSMGHGVKNADELINLYIDAVISKRLGGDKADLAPFDITESWSGDLKSYEIVQKKSNSKNTTWLPDEATAKAWQNFLKK